MSDIKRLIGVTGEPGLPGPTSHTFFELNGGWSEKYVELQGLCSAIYRFMRENPEVASVVEITKDAMKSRLR